MFDFDSLEIGKKKSELPTYEQETKTLRVDIRKERGFAIYLAARNGTSRLANVNRRKALVTGCRVIGETVLEVDLKFCDFAVIRKV
ncbi:hypothetical protein OIX85_003891 [Vibrio parahaemolyticus]|nr:hypothetical protein [Vibrio parahaemolyticus]